VRRSKPDSLGTPLQLFSLVFKLCSYSSRRFKNRLASALAALTFPSSIFRPPPLGAPALYAAPVSDRGGKREGG